MFIKVDLLTFRDYFNAIRPNNFTYQGLEVLFDYLEEMEEYEEQCELDVIALCCDFSEDTPETIAASYNIEIYGMDESEIISAVKEYLEDESAYVGETDTTIVYQNI